jgi:hypothetical protein
LPSVADVKRLASSGLSAGSGSPDAVVDKLIMSRRLPERAR